MSAHNLNREWIPPTRQKGHAVCYVIFTQHGPWRLMQSFISGTCNSASNFLPTIPIQTIISHQAWQLAHPTCGNCTHIYSKLCGPSITIGVLVSKMIPSALSLSKYHQVAKWCLTLSMQVSNMICPLTCYDERGREQSESCWCQIVLKVG